jgi:hypothetical protein
MNGSTGVFGEADPPDDELLESDQTTLLMLTQVLENPATLLRPYSDEALSQAFWDLSSEAFPIVHNVAIDWTLRHRFIRSFEILFRELFAARCTPTLGHWSEVGSALNSACYMWWDFGCWWMEPDPLTPAFLESMRSILAIDHVACQESALHGLGHWHGRHAHGAAVENIIDEFLKNEPHLSELLRVYAGAARCGCVL